MMVASSAYTVFARSTAEGSFAYRSRAVQSVPAPVADLLYPPQPARNVLRVISAFVTDVGDQMTQMINSVLISP